MKYLLLLFIVLFWLNLKNCAAAAEEEVDEKLRPENVQHAWNEYLINFNKTYSNETEANLR